MSINLGKNIKTYFFKVIYGKLLQKNIKKHKNYNV
jgi:hypothetical protein